MEVGEGKHPRLLIALAVLLVFALSISKCRAGGGPRDVAVVINAASAESVEIGRYYQAARGIPESNICTISCPNQEIVSWTVCEQQIKDPIARFLSRPEIAGRIHYIVLTKGIPLSADYVDGILDGNTNDYYSVGSILVDLHTHIVDVTGPNGVPDGKPDNMSTLLNPYGPNAASCYGFTAPAQAWRQDLFDSGDAYDINKRLYLVTRLDGFNVQQIKQAIDRSVCPAPDGKFILDRNNWNTGAYRTANARLGDQTSSAYYYLTTGGYVVSFDSGTEFISNETNVMGYFSWASNDYKYTFEKYMSNSFVPGSIADSYYSFSGRTFNDPGTTNRQPLIADLFSRGVCGVGGYVAEPMITTSTYPNTLFDRYTEGFNMAESFYAACPTLRWKTVIAGDPLMAPFATPPQVTVNVSSTILRDVETVSASVYDASGVGRVVFYLDNTVIGVVNQAPYCVELDTREYPIGVHVLEAVAYENSPTATQGSAKLQVVIDNAVSAEDHIADSLVYQDGQYVRLKGKIVTAGTDDIGDGFYIEEPDRGSGLRVVSDFHVNRGDVVTVTGPMATGTGERAVTGLLVTVDASGHAVPAPLLVRLCDLGGAARGLNVSPVGAGVGARNTGLLIKAVGRIVSSQAGRFEITDGSTQTPVSVICPGLGSLPVGALVSATGISEAEQDGSRFRPVIRARDAGDIRLL